MKFPAFTLITLLAMANLLAQGAPDMETLRARSTEQERQIRALENEIENLHSQLALERRRSRGVQPSNSSASPASPTRFSYTVRTGDTLSAIARRYKTSADALTKTNGIADPALLRVGQQLSFPEGTPTPEKPAEVLAGSQRGDAKTEVREKPEAKKALKVPEDARDYTVQRGDTLYGIARLHKIPVSSLRTLNPEIEDKIIIGQTITVVGSALNTHPPQAHPVSTGITKKKTRSSANTETSKRGNMPSPAPKPKPTPPVEKQPAAPEQEPALASENTGSQPVALTGKISSVLVSEQVSFGDFASRHGTTTTQLNQLNGWDFKDTLVLARGSEIYVPTR